MAFTLLMKFNTKLLLFAIFFGLQCRKHNDIPTQLPPITQEGKNTFGFKVNSEIWVPYFSCTTTSGRPCHELFRGVVKILNQPFWDVYIGADVKYKDNSIASFSLNTLASRGITSMGDKTDSFSLEFVKPGIFIYNEFPGISADKNVTITRFDTLNRIISGTFRATLYNSMLKDSLKITEGRFDFKFE